MTTKYDGGCAFPAPEYGEIGMSLRDWFAGLAMQGECAASTHSRPDVKEMAKFAYRVADAMLAAREAE